MRGPEDQGYAWLPGTFTIDMVSSAAINKPDVNLGDYVDIS